MNKVRIEYAKPKCIGVKKCIEIAPEFFSFENNKAQLHNAIMGPDIDVATVSLSQEQITKLTNAAKSCPVNAIQIHNIDTSEDLATTAVNTSHAKIVEAKYDDDTEFVLDPEGYFLIRIKPETKTIEVGFCNSRNDVTLTIVGSKPIDIYQTIINKQSLPIRKDHCAYLGRELQKAFMALQLGLKYIQDDELDFMKKL